MSRRSVAICGSCPTRDNFSSRFNPEHDRWYRIDLANFQSSMIALMSPPVEGDPVAGEDLKDHTLGVIRADLDRRFLAGLADLRPDFLLLDFSGDVAFGALRLADGRYVTDNPYTLQTSTYYQRLLADGATHLGWRADPTAYRAVWTEAMDRFAALVAETCPETTVIVHRYRSVNAVVLSEHDRPRDLRRWARLQPLEIRRINTFRASLDDLAVTRYGWDSIDLRAERYTSDARHPWGPHYVHYTLDYHPRFLAELHRRDLAERIDPDTMEKITLIADAGSRRLRNQAAFLDDADRTQAAAIRDAEARGILETLRKVVMR
jgi:hypothetical protein